jgi:hypothetical protein
MGRGTLSASYPLAALWYPNPEISDLIHVLTPGAGGWETSNFLLSLYVYTAAAELVLTRVDCRDARVCQTCRLTICKQAGCCHPGLELRPRSTQL